jgi:hypothetical protein
VDFHWCYSGNFRNLLCVPIAFTYQQQQLCQEGNTCTTTFRDGETVGFLLAWVMLHVNAVFAETEWDAVMITAYIHSQPAFCCCTEFVYCSASEQIWSCISFGHDLVQTSTFSTQLARRWQWGVSHCRPFYSQGYYWYSFLLKAESTTGQYCRWKD